jgi:hypothetical protein
MYTYVPHATIFTLINHDATLTPAPREQVEKGERRPAHPIVHLTCLYQQIIRLSTPAPYLSLSLSLSLSQSTTLRVPTASVVSITVTTLPFHLSSRTPLLPFLLHFHLHFQIPSYTPDSNANPKPFITFDSRCREVMHLRICHMGVMNFSGSTSSKLPLPLYDLLQSYITHVSAIIMAA